MTKYGAAVTDPNLLSQLNSGSNSVKYGSPITDPNLLAQLNSGEVNQSLPPEQSSNFFQRSANQANKSLVDINPEYLDPRAMGKAALQSAGILGSLYQPEVGILAGLAPQVPKLANILTRLGAQSGYGAMASPDHPLLGASLGGTGSALTQLMGIGNPIINAIARAGLGGLVGYGLGGTKGAETGAGLGLGLPFLRNRLGIGLGEAGSELLQNISPNEVYKTNRAANALNTTLSPGEASARPDITAQEGRLGRVGIAAPERVNIGKERINQQKNAISSLENMISPTNENALLATRQAAKNAILSKQKLLQEKVDPLYKKSFQKEIEPEKLTMLMNSDKTIKNAVNAARNDPAYSVELQGYAPNSIKVLDAAKVKIDADIAKAINYGDFDRARVLRASKQRLVDATDRFSKDYAKARKTYEEGMKPIEELQSGKLGQIANIGDVNVKNISKMIFDPAQTDIKVLKTVRDQIREQDPAVWDNLVKNEMKRMMSKGEVKGTTFFKKVLQNDNTFNQLLTALDHNPQAKKQLIHMRRAWKDLIDIETPRSAAGLASTGMKQARNPIDALIDTWHEIVGTKRDKEALRVIYSKDWQKKLNDISMMKDKELKSKKMSDLLSSLLRGTINVATPKE